MTAAVLSLALLPGADPAGDEFFEKRVRPLLAEHCVKCHGPDKQKGGVRLDRPDDLLRDLDGGGPLVKPGDPKAGRLLAAVRHAGDYPMPPGKKLPDDQIAALAKWVEQGAAWPAAATKPADPAKPHWAFQPVRPPAVPEVRNPKSEIRNEIDRFLLAKLEGSGLGFAPPADPRALLRRLHFDLTGLPPTAAEVVAFARDPSPAAVEGVVDKLLASPAYGERWGRHWLDVARYADTREAGFQVDVRYPFAWTYRDWVIGAFNRDLPFDAFVARQLGADFVVDRPDHPDLAALGFLGVGRRFSAGRDGNENDMIDDRLDVIGRGLMGLSISCARCHDHKFDPIPTADYYSLFGVFKDGDVTDLPFAATDADRAKMAAFRAETVRRRQKWDDYSLGQHAALFGDAFSAKGYAWSLMEAVRNAGKDVEMPPGAKKINLAERRRGYLKSQMAEDWHHVIGPLAAFAKLPAGEFAAKAPGVVKKVLGDEPFTEPAVKALFRDRPPPASLQEVADRYGGLFESVDKRWRAAMEPPRTAGVPFAGLADPAEEAVRKYLTDNGLGYIPTDELHYVLDGDVRQEWLKLQQAIADLKTGPAAPPHAMGYKDPPYHHEPHVFVRGNPANKGAEVPQRFLAVATAGDRKPFEDRKGRRDLAAAVTDPRNPLTARVWANRVWGHLFGRGLVRTPSDFGTRGDPPTHPELLDHLAHTFVADGWSTKKLVRRIVLSRAYAQSSAVESNVIARDPQNRLLGRADRRRLDLEAYRDAALAVGGALDPATGGPPFDLSADPTARRRTVYAKVDRVALSALHRAFDFANPDLHTPQRFVTTVPQQAVLLLNHPFPAEAARRLADRVDKESDSADPGRWVGRAYRLALGRDPSAAERARAAEYLATTPPPKPPANRPVYWAYGLAKWDADAKTLTGFEPLKDFSDDAWADAKAGKAKLTATGGQAGAGGVVLVRRWTAPAAGTVHLDGRFAPKVEGATAVAVAGGKVAGTWAGKPDGVRTEVEAVAVKAGEAVDFFALPPAGGADAEFDWRFTLEPVNSPAMGRMVWNSAGHFDGPAPAAGAPLTPKQQLAHVLLLSNEFATLD